MLTLFFEEMSLNICAHPVVSVSSPHCPHHHLQTAKSSILVFLTQVPLFTYFWCINDAYVPDILELVR